MSSKLAVIALLMCICAFGLTGCGGFDSGYYFLSGDVAGIAGAEAPVVVRLMRREIFGISSTVDNQPVMLSVKGQPLRAAITDDSGYGSAAVQLPDITGECEMKLIFQDTRGLELSQSVPCWVYAADMPVLIVDVADALQRSGEISETLNNMVSNGWQFCYALEAGVKSLSSGKKFKAQLAATNLPAGAVLNWKLDSGGKAIGPLAILAQSYKLQSSGAADSPPPAVSEHIKVLHSAGMEKFAAAAEIGLLNSDFKPDTQAK